MTASDDLINRCLPTGATGQTLTLNETSYAIYNVDGTLYRIGKLSRYPIYREVNDKGTSEFYVDASGDGPQYSAFVWFKEVAPFNNTYAAKELASNALADAAFAFLDRHKQQLATYKIEK